MVLNIVLLIIFILFIFLLIVGCVDGNRFRVVEENISLEKISKDFRFVLISDLHNKVYGNHNKKVIEAVNNANPDFVIIAGDLVTSHAKEKMTPAIELIHDLSRNYKIYYAMGNHETKIRTDIKHFGNSFEEYKKQIQSSQTVILQNENVCLQDYNVMISGLELDRYYFSRFKKRELKIETLERNLGKCQKDYCNMLIAHHPDYFEEYEQWGADFVLSGHVHGGIMRLPFLGGVISPSYVLFPKYDGGIFKIKQSIMLLGRGMGAHTIPFRFFNPAELYVVNCLHK